MATQNLDLESQEQLDQLKYFWGRYGNLITSTVIAASLAFLGWQYYQKSLGSNSAQASEIYAAMVQAATGNDAAKVERTWSDLQSKYSGTAYAEQGALLAASSLATDKATEAQAALQWEVDHGKHDAYRALARLRLASLLAQAKKYDEAQKVLGTDMPAAFAGLAADRLGDIHMAQGKPELAKAQYRKAYEALAADDNYRNLVEIKLNALGGGVQPAAGATGSASAAASSAAQPAASAASAASHS